MLESKINNYNIDSPECINIQKELRKETWVYVLNMILKDIKLISKLIFAIGLTILGLMIINFLTDNFLQINFSLLGMLLALFLLTIITFVMVVITNIMDFKPILFAKISKLLLVQIPNLNFESNDSEDFFENFYQDLSGDILAKLKIINLKIPNSKLLLKFFYTTPSLIPYTYLCYVLKDKIVQIIAGRIKAGVNCQNSSIFERTLFKGILISINKNNLFNGNVCILEKNTFYFKRKPFANIPLVNIENPLLKKYSIYSDNHSDLNKILEPNFLNAFLNLKKVFKGRVIDFGTNGNEIIIMIKTNKKPHKNLNLFTSINFNKLQEICEQQYAIINFINILK